MRRRVSKLHRLETQELIDDWGVHPPVEEVVKELTLKTMTLRNDWDFPVIFNLDKDMKSFRQSGVMRKIEIRRINDNFEQYFYRKRTQKFIILLFWIIFCRMYPNNVKDPLDEKLKVLDKLRLKMSKNYPRRKPR